MKSFCYLAIVAASLLTPPSLIPSLAQKLVDPNTVAPEFREAAEKRRAEQIRVSECTRKANEAKVLPRDRAEHINHCLEESVRDKVTEAKKPPA
jgi:hypothetical protein